jgi:hypothetical protein
LLKRIVGGALATVLVVGVIVTVGSTSASAAPTGLLWGPRYTNSFTFHQKHNGSASPALVSSDGFQKFLIQDDGNLVTYKKFNDPVLRWYPYWASHTDKTGYYLHLQSDGNIVERAADNRTVVWASNHHPGTRYNYWLVMQNDGNLVEYYATGDPRNTPRSVAWAINRLTNQHRVCNSGSVAADSTTSFRMLVQNGAGLSVKVNNRNFLGLAVTVSRWQNNRENGAQSYVIAPYSSHTFSGWYEGDNYPEYVTMHIRTPSNNVVAGYQATGWCWYTP